MKSIDYAPLTAPTSDAMQKVVTQDAVIASQMGKLRRNMYMVAVFCGLLVTGVISGAQYNTAGLAGALGVAVMVGIITLPLCLFIANWLVQRQVSQVARYVSFAQSNGLTYRWKEKEIAENGIIFTEGYDQCLTHSFSDAETQRFCIGNYTYTTGSGRSRQTHDWGYVRVKLSRNVPHMVLDATQNNMRLLGMNLSSLPVTFDRDQKLSLEGDFDKYFTLYAPKEYERDALYVFTPDLMALLIDESAQFDAETVDDQLYIYSSTPFDLTKPAVMEKLFTIIDLVGDKVIDRTDYYADERVGTREADQIASQGRRLKTRLSTLTIVIVVVYILIEVVPHIIDVLTR